MTTTGDVSVGETTVRQAAIGSLMFYLAAYSLATIGIFATLMHLAGDGAEGEQSPPTERIDQLEIELEVRAAERDVEDLHRDGVRPRHPRVLGLLHDHVAGVGLRNRGGQDQIAV